MNRSLVLRHVSDSGAECNPGSEGNEALLVDIAAIKRTEPTCLGSPDRSLEYVKAWLDAKCEEEEARAQALADAEDDELRRLACGITASSPDSGPLGMDTKIIEQIRRGEWPRDKVVEDLLAPLRLGKLKPAGQESYNDMERVLLAWNHHVSRQTDDGKLREAFGTALRDRLKAIKKVLEIVRDEQESKIYDEIGHEGILEPSAWRLRQAMHAYRPETVHFKNQDPYDMLILLLANVGRAIPDILGDDELMYLTFRVMTAETELAQRFRNGDTRRRIKSKIQEARWKRDRAELVHRKEEMSKFNRRVARDSVQYNLDKIKLARIRLQQVVLAELLELTVPQAAQKWVRWQTVRQSWPPPVSEVLEVCVQADINLERTVGANMDDLDANCTVACNNVQEMRNIHHAVYTRALKFAGMDLAGVDEATRRRIIEQRKNEPVTALLMSESLRGVLEAQRAAKQLVRQTEAMDRSLSDLLEAAKARYQEYDGLLRLLDTAPQGLDETGDINVTDAQTLEETVNRTNMLRYTFP